MVFPVLGRSPNPALDTDPVYAKALDEMSPEQVATRGLACLNGAIPDGMAARFFHGFDRKVIGLVATGERQIDDFLVSCRLTVDPAGDGHLIRDVRCITHTDGSQRRFVVSTNISQTGGVVRSSTTSPSLAPDLVAAVRKSFEKAPYASNTLSGALGAIAVGAATGFGTLGHFAVTGANVTGARFWTMYAGATLLGAVLGIATSRGTVAVRNMRAQQARRLERFQFTSSYSAERHARL